MNVKILEEFKPEVKVFERKEDFVKYLGVNINDLKGLSTYKLNKMFKVNGYRVTKIKGEIGLATNHYVPKSDGGKKKKEEEVDEEAIKLLNEKVDYIFEILRDNKLIGYEE